MKTSLIFLILLSLLLSCSTTNGGKKKAVELNDRAVELMSRQFMDCGVDSILMDSIYQASLILLEEAVLKDSTNPTVAANKFKVEVLLKNYDGAISTFKKLERSRGSLDPVLRLFMGLCYLKQHKNSEAMNSLERARDEFQAKGDTSNYYFAKCFIDGKESVIRQIDTIPSLNELKDIILQMDMSIDEMIR